MSAPRNAPDPAKGRFFAITALRLMAIVLIALGVAMAAGRIAWIAPGIAPVSGIVMIGLGLLDLIVIVPMLIRRWRSGAAPDERDDE